MSSENYVLWLGDDRRFRGSATHPNYPGWIPLAHLLVDDAPAGHGRGGVGYGPGWKKPQGTRIFITVSDLRPVSAMFHAVMEGTYLPVVVVVFLPKGRFGGSLDLRRCLLSTASPPQTSRSGDRQFTFELTAEHAEFKTATAAAVR